MAALKSPNKLRPRQRLQGKQQQQEPQQQQQQQQLLLSSNTKKTNAFGRLFQRNKNHGNAKKLKKIKIQAPLSNLLQQDDDHDHDHDHDDTCIDNHDNIAQEKSVRYTVKTASSSLSRRVTKKRKDQSNLLYEDDGDGDGDVNEEKYFHSRIDDCHDAMNRSLDRKQQQEYELNISGEYGNDMGCTLENAWNMLCQNGAGVHPKNQDDAANDEQQFHVHVDVMQDLSPEELAGMGLQQDLYVAGSSNDDSPQSQQQQQQQRQQRNENESMMLTRSALSRPFGRTSLPAHLAKKWVVQVSTAGYDKMNGGCLYNIMVQVEDPGTYAGTPIPSPIRDALANDSSSGGSASLVAASVDRSLNDFMWLEDALLQEYRGSLIFPMLSLAVTSWDDLDVSSLPQSMDMKSFHRRIWDPVQASIDLLDVAIHSKEPLDTKLLADWLNDVLNSIRGKGELILNHKMEDVIYSEAMETFLYKTSSPLPKPKRKYLNSRRDADGSLLDFRNVFQLQDSRRNDCVQSALAGLVKVNLKCLGIMDGCDLSRSQDDEFYTNGSGEKLSLPRRNSQQSKNESSSGTLQQHSSPSKSLCAQRFYIAMQKENTLRAMYSLRILLDKEILLSTAWKRLAISLSMLFASEKDIEMCKVATTKTSSPSKFIKIDKETVDDNLRILARQKVDRSIPSLKVLSGMLNAYYVDFSSVDPSLDEYARSIQKVMSPDDTNSGGWQSQLKAISPVKLLNMGSSDDSKCSPEQQEMKRQEITQKLTANEEHMISSITQFCKATKIRTARMSWKYFKMELGQVSLLLSACEQSKANLKRAMSRNDCRLDVEKAHIDREIELVKLIMELGLKKKYKYNPIPKSSCGSSHTSSETSEVSEFDKSREGDSETMTTDEWGTIQSKEVENIVSLSKEYAGRWNLDFTVKMLEASGIPNVSFDMEETSKNIRVVQKLTTALLESVERCQKTVDMLKAFAVKDKNQLPMHVLRNDFSKELVRVFSCTCNASSSSSSKPMNASYERILSSFIGVDIYDSAGWLKQEEVRGGGRCGTATVKYEAMRNHGAHDFIRLLEERLESYQNLIQEIENYTWMYRAGDYIEKYYSNARAEAVAAWEKKTDITTAITIATKKKLKLLVNELKEKLELIGDSVSYSSVREAKERHLGSKAIKGELESLACRRFQKLKETCTDHSLSIINEWTLREESIAKTETKYLNEIIREIESNVRRHENAIQADGGAHLFAVSSLSRKPSSSTTRSSSHSSI